MHSDIMLREGQNSQATAKEIEKLLSNVELELRPWAKSGITLEMVERAYCLTERTDSMRFQVLPTLWPRSTLMQTHRTINLWRL